jgi:type IV pilus assembly protein PilE
MPHRAYSLVRILFTKEEVMSATKKYQTGKLSAEGFSLIELMVVIAVIGILAGIAYPNYTDYIYKSHRANAQSELLQLASVQEKIFLNANSYTPTLVGLYNGTGAGGLGATVARTDGGTGRYDLGLTVTPAGCDGVATACTAFTLIATPRAGQNKDAFGTMSLAGNGTKTRNIEATAKTGW